MALRVLDLFCGAGGAAMGYSRAGFDEIVGIDIHPQPNYPFAFIQADALNPPVDLSGFDLIHASPPCQAYTNAGARWNKELGPPIERAPDLLPATRLMLGSSNVPWIIENVPGAPMQSYVVLCGLAFGLGVKRHRWFETSFPVLSIPCPSHNKPFVLVFGGGVRGRAPQTGRTLNNGPIVNRPTLPLAVGREAMGIDWMNRRELSEAIPPAYTQFLGEQFLQQVAV